LRLEVFRFEYNKNSESFSKVTSFRPSGKAMALKDSRAVAGDILESRYFCGFSHSGRVAGNQKELTDYYAPRKGSTVTVGVHFFF
jgi:hypothetical protein